MWAVAIVMMAVMFYGMYAGDGFMHKHGEKKDVNQQVIKNEQNQVHKHGALTSPAADKNNGAHQSKTQGKQNRGEGDGMSDEISDEHRDGAGNKEDVIR